jgi:hypothetical protein
VDVTYRILCGLQARAIVFAGLGACMALVSWIRPHPSVTTARKRIPPVLDAHFDVIFRSCARPVDIVPSLRRCRDSVAL